MTDRVVVYHEARRLAKKAVIARLNSLITEYYHDHLKELIAEAHANNKTSAPTKAPCETSTIPVQMLGAK
jgi:hypothetical protein